MVFSKIFQKMLYKNNYNFLGFFVQFDEIFFLHKNPLKRIFMQNSRRRLRWRPVDFLQLPKMILDKNKKSPQTLFILPCPAVPLPKATHAEPNSVGCVSGVADWLPLGSHLYTAQQDSVRSRTLSSQVLLTLLESPPARALPRLPRLCRLALGLDRTFDTRRLADRLVSSATVVGVLLSLPSPSGIIISYLNIFVKDFLKFF